MISKVLLLFLLFCSFILLLLDLSTRVTVGGNVFREQAFASVRGTFIPKEPHLLAAFIPLLYNDKGMNARF